jgi:hypothetical protein
MCSSAKGITNRLVVPGWLQIFVCAWVCCVGAFWQMGLGFLSMMKWDASSSLPFDLPRA